MRPLHIVGIVALVIGLFFSGWLSSDIYRSMQKTGSKQIETTPIDYSRYEILKLQDAKPNVTSFVIGDLLNETEKYNAYEFSMIFSPDPENQKQKKVTGRLTIPNVDTPKGVIVMLRGYVDKTVFKSGDGTKNAGNYFTEDGYITVAPDFLGYGESDTESSHIFEARFQTYTTVLALLETIEGSSLNPNILSGNSQVTNLLTNQYPIFIWSHSNGGHIALTILEITKEKYPTVLWAPVTKPFPYSVLYYTDESNDQGVFIRKQLALFEQTHTAKAYSLREYLPLIEAPIAIYQGTADTAVPYLWSREIAQVLRELGKDVEYNEYAGSDHNLRPAWDSIVEANLEFFDKYSKK
jgi:alpha-beta hydrolase superfamily lysophospholipase